MRHRWVGAAAVLAGCSLPAGAPPARDTVQPLPPPMPAVAEPAPFPEPAALATLFGPDYDRALASVGLTREAARCTPQDLSLAGQGRFRTPLYEALQADPTLVDRYARTFREAAFAAAKTPEGAAMFAAARIGAGVRITLLGDPLKDEVVEAEKPGALEAALKDLGLEETPETAGLPPKVSAAAALILRAASRAEMRTFQSMGGVFLRLEDSPHRGDPSEATLLLAPEDQQDLRRELFERDASQVDLRHLARATAEMAVAVERAAAWIEESGDAPPFEVRWETGFGTVLLRGGADDADGDGDGDRGPFLLRIDTGGNDIYRAGAAADPDNPLAILIDRAGDDRYEALPGVPAFGAGFGGVGILMDLAGNDTYRLGGEKSLGLGAGVFGAGILLDAAGDDLYVGNDFCMGAATVGFGVLADLGGKDRYEAFSYSQGFGFVLGSGLLVDLSGDDAYVLDDTDIRRPAAQSKEHNSSLGQGFGYGVRADYLDGHSLAGGVGILADREGNDTYSCGIFGQGGGYWMGVGMLLEGGGNDAYDGVWYVQGATAHFAVGVLDDAAGDDRYTATMNMAQGAGHDYSIGALMDRGGNDTYVAPNLSLGGGNADGVGLFVDAAGDDSYRSSGITLGAASVATPPDAPSLRHGSLTLGVFLDLAGRDAYLDGEGKLQGFAGDGRIWRSNERSGAAPASNERGVGLDR